MTRPNVEARKILDTIRYVAVATVSEDGAPWNTPVASFHFDNDYMLYWASWRENQHSRNIRANGKAFVVAYDSTPEADSPMPGVYLAGQAYELTDEHEVMNAALVFQDDAYNSSDGKYYLGGHPRRIYKFVPQQFWLNADGKVHGNFVDIRVEAQEQ